MEPINQLIQRNRHWAQRVKRDNPTLFEELARGQAPDYIWIGCADSRDPPNVIADLGPGEIFVHRNVANLAVPGDLNCMSAIYFAVVVLKVPHVVVCGHYRCGGVEAVVEDQPLGVVDRWLHPLSQLYDAHRLKLDRIEDIHEREDRLCELNVIHQVRNVCSMPAVRDAWTHGRKPAVHGLMYRLDDGLLHDLNISVNATEQVEDTIRAAIDRVLGDDANGS